MGLLSSIQNITTALYTEYNALWNAATVKPAALAKVKIAYAKMLQNKPRYEAIAKALNVPGVPWYLIAVIHSRESNFDFTTHFHNGDPLVSKKGVGLKTVLVPANRPNFPPANGKSYTFEESCLDALRMKIYEKGNALPAWANGVNDASVASLLHKIETWNGAGYRKTGKPSPYLWSDSTVQQPGKYIGDHNYSPTYMDTQLGAATLLKYFLEQNQDAKKKD